MSLQPDASVDTGLLRNNTGWTLGLSRHAFFSSQVRRCTFQRNVWKMWGRIKRGKTTKCIANRMHFTANTCPDSLRTASQVLPDACLHFSAHFSSLLSSVHPRSMSIHSVSPSGAESIHSDCVSTHRASTRATPEHCGAAPAEPKFLGSLQVPCCFPDTVVSPKCVHQRLACLWSHRTHARLTCRDSTVRWGQEGPLRTLRGVLHPSCLRVPLCRMSGCCVSASPILFLKMYVSIALVGLVCRGGTCLLLWSCWLFPADLCSMFWVHSTLSPPALSPA